MTDLTFIEEILVKGYELLISRFPVAATIVMAIGTTVVVLTIIDGVIPDKYDRGFMGYFRRLPVVKQICNVLTRFSLFRIEKKK